MESLASSVAALASFIHRRFIWCLLSSYFVAAYWPAWGLWIRTVKLGKIESWSQPTVITLPMAMLAMLLLNAGLGIELNGIRSLAANVKVLACGVAANILVPLGFIYLVSQGMGRWHNPSETQNILVGLALVASMPIAGSSTAWSQNANGNMTVSLGLVLATTFLSPWATPLALHSVGYMTTGDFAEDLHELANQGTGMFLAVCVILPSIAGISLRSILGRDRVTSVKPHLKLANSLVLLTLVYSNASVSLPKAIAQPDFDFLSIMLVIAVSLCSVAFFSGWLIARLLKADSAQRTSLMFGLGMNNNGTGLVLASMALADHPRVMLPIIMYNLIQHLVAGTVDHILFTKGVKSLEPE